MSNCGGDLPVRALCLDIEGGFGGSSRSLYFVLKHIDRRLASPEVWCKRDGPIRAKYEALGIPVRVQPWLPKVSSLLRPSRNLYALAQFSVDFARCARERKRMVDEVRSRFDLIHFNHEAFYLLAYWMRSKCHAAQVMHVRTQIPENVFSRIQAKIVTRANDSCIYITERERENICRLAKLPVSGLVLSNVAEVQDRSVASCRTTRGGGIFKIACLANYSWMRGTDRLIHIAGVLRTMGRTNVRFVVAGTMDLKGSLPGQLGVLARRHATLREYADLQGVGDMFDFLGHVSEPEVVLQSVDALIKPSREDNPWGRDVLEAMAMGIPVLACGTFGKFVKPGVSGFLYPNSDGAFDARQVAHDVARLSDDWKLAFRLGEGARQRVAVECSGPARAKDLVAVWSEAIERRTNSRGRFD